MSTGKGAIIGRRTARWDLAVFLVVFVLGWSGITAVAFAQQITLRYWDFIDPALDSPRSIVLAQHVRRFEAANPNIKVNVEVIPWQVAILQLIQSGAAGKTPDVARVQHQHLRMAIKAGVYRSLNEFTERWPASVRNGFVMDYNATVWKGQKVGIPYEHRVVPLWYRKDLLDAAGLEVPKTVDEMIEVARKINKNHVMGMAIGLSSGSLGTSFGDWFYPALWAGGGDLVDENEEPTFQGEAGVRAFQMLADLVRKGGMATTVCGWGYDQVEEAFKAENIGMTVLGAHRIVAARAASKLGNRLQTAWYPGYTRGNPPPGHVFGHDLVMGKDTKNPEAAWKFIEHMTSAESQIIAAKNAGEMPSRKSAFDDPWFKSKDGAEMMFWKDYADHGRMPSPPEKYIALMEILTGAAQEVVLRNVPPQSALNKAAERYRDLRR